MKTVRETLVETIKRGRKVEAHCAMCSILANALENFMAAEGGEAGETPDQKRAWKTAEAILAQYKAKVGE